MKKTIKMLISLVIMLVLALVCKETVFAANAAPNTLTVDSYAINPKPLGLDYNISVKKATNGKYVYCFDVNKAVPTGIVYSKGLEVQDQVIASIISSGLDDKNDNEFFATQAALWMYLVEIGAMKDTDNEYIRSITLAVNNTHSSDAIAQDIQNILKEAKSLKPEAKSPYINIDTDEIEFKLKKGNYVSNEIKIDTNLSEEDYLVALKGAPKGSEFERDGDTIVITIPEKNVEEGTTGFELHVTGSYQSTKVYGYETNEIRADGKEYQQILVPYEDIEIVSDDIVLSITKEVEKEEEPEVEDPTIIIISKKDGITKEYLEGAVLVVKNSKGKEVLRWTTDNDSKKITGLDVGKYTLEEVSAPEGYQLSKEIKSFEVKEDGKTKRIVFYNYEEEIVEVETVVSISKQDITTKEELPGATLIIKDSKGKEIDKWVSGDEPHIIKGLKEGKYTLEEITSPDGYVLSSEIITFEVKNNGVVTEVVMFNTPESVEVIVPATGTDANKITYILGGLIIIIGSVLIYKNVKKEQ